MLVIKFVFDKIFSLSYMGKLGCCKILYYLYDIRILSQIVIVYCTLIMSLFIYAYYGLTVYSIKTVNLHEVWGHSTLCNIHIDKYGYGYEVLGYMDCGNTPYSIISIQIQTWIWIWSKDLHQVWRHFTFHNVHIKMDMAPCSHIITVSYFRY